MKTLATYSFFIKICLETDYYVLYIYMLYILYICVIYIIYIFYIFYMYVIYMQIIAFVSSMKWINLGHISKGLKENFFGHFYIPFLYILDMKNYKLSPFEM